MAEKILAVIVEPGKPARKEMVENTLEAFQKIVDGYIETFYPYDDCIFVVNDFGKFNGSQRNRKIAYDNGYDIIFGPFAIVGEGIDNFASLSEDVADKYVEMFK